MKCISPLLAVFLLLFSVLDATYGGDPIYGVFVFLVQQESDRVHVNCGEGTKSAECTALLWIQGVEGGSNHLDWNREQGQNDEALYTCHISKNIVVPGLNTSPHAPENRPSNGYNEGWFIAYGGYYPILDELGNEIDRDYVTGVSYPYKSKSVPCGFHEPREND